jgi:pantoate--beta-alanine ligase
MTDEPFLLIKTTNEFLAWRKRVQDPIGLVPTMGNLHAGHLRLVETSLLNNSITIVTIFVNPKQFGPKEDWDRYPRTLTKDCELLFEMFEAISKQQPSKQLIIFAPANPEEIYPPGFQTKISVSDLEQRWEGVHRPGHFAGVATIVFLLFQITRPLNAYFGLKDYQQFQIIKKMNIDLRLNLQLHGMDTIRDVDGLALSSRNQYLTPNGRKQALQLPHSLKYLQQYFALCNSMSEFNQKIKEITQIDERWEYLACCHPDTLLPLSELANSAILLAVYRVDNTRLLDNLLLVKNL